MFLISNVAFRKNLRASELARFHPNPRWSSPRLYLSESQLRRCWPCWVRRESLKPELNPKRKDICQKTWDRKSPELSAKVWRHSKRRRRQCARWRDYKLSNLGSTLLLLEKSYVRPNALASSRSDLECSSLPYDNSKGRSSSPFECHREIGGLVRILVNLLQTKIFVIIYRSNPSLNY